MSPSASDDRPPQGALCRLEELDDPGSAAFQVERDGRTLPVLVVRRSGEIYGYVNSCPHIGVPLDWVSGRVLDASKTFVLCASHGALFRIEDGFCISGPCAEKSLESFPLTLSGSWVLPL